MKRTTARGRLLSWLMVLVMVLGLFPTAAIPALAADGQPASDGFYHVTFTKDAFNSVTVKVGLINSDSTPADLTATSEINLDGANFQIGDGTITAYDIVSGYNARTITATTGGSSTGGTYYYQQARWGKSGEVFSSEMTYEEIAVKATSNTPLYLQYKFYDNTPFNVKAYVLEKDGTESPTPIVESKQVNTSDLSTQGGVTGPDGEITAQLQQYVVSHLNPDPPTSSNSPHKGYYAFARAELRNNNNNRVPITHVQLINGYYYVQTELGAQQAGQQNAFPASDWTVVFLYERANQLTLTVSGASEGDKINGVQATNG